MAKPTGRPPGTPSIYTQEIADHICLELSRGRHLHQICRAEGMPSAETVRIWDIEDKNGFHANYARARDLGIQALVERAVSESEFAQMGEVIDETTVEGPAGTTRTTKISRRDAVDRSALFVNTIKWYASKIAPKRYSEHMDVTVRDESGLAAELAEGRARMNARRAKKESKEK